MDFKATPVTIDNLLSGRKQYAVSRNQRDFSWEEEHLREFWNDLIFNMPFNPSTDAFKHEEYFIGAIVLAGNEDGFELQIVDGQQRITVLTTLISAICHTLKNIPSADGLGKSIYDNYIEGTDFSRDKSQKYFKLKRQASSKYFELQIQNFERISRETETLEDALLKEAYEYFASKLTKENISREIIKRDSIDDDLYIRGLLALNLQLTTKIKVIKVVVSDEDDAYVIFEILNARGLDLDSADLIKNKIFNDLRLTHPIDFAKDKWESIRTALSTRDSNVKISTFIRHWWNSRYPLVSENSLYKAFKEGLCKVPRSASVKVPLSSPC